MLRKHRTCLLNKDVSIKLRLKLFDPIVSPTLLFGMATLPLTLGQLRQVDVIQRRMLRSIVGWVRVDNEDWAATMRRMNARVQAAMAIFPVQPWTEQLARRQYSLAARFSGGRPTWATKAALWDFTTVDAFAHYVPHRSPGRPQRRWDDFLGEFALEHFASECSVHSASHAELWLAEEQTYVNLIKANLYS